MNDLQKTILQVFSEVEQIITRLDLRYFAIGGTAIGAVRHNGFIPWDDDLDIAMPVEDFEIFVRTVARELPERYAVMSSSKSSHYQFAFIKVFDSSTTVIERGHYLLGHNDNYTGAWVDIMPMCGVPASWFGRRIFLGKHKFLMRANGLMRLPELPDESTGRTIASNVLSPLRHTQHSNMFDKHRWALLRSHPFNGSQYTGYTWSYKLPRLIFPTEWFASHLEFPFENLRIRVPVGYREYLTQQFEDYMSLPSVDEQINHECFVDLEHSYKDYALGKLSIPEGYFDKLDARAEGEGGSSAR